MPDIQANGLSFHYDSRGPESEGTPVILMIMGLGVQMVLWPEPLLDALAQQGFRVVRFDLPGCGLSGVDPTGDYRDARSMQVLSALLDTLHIARATLIGNSMGGRIAWSYAAAHPERVERLVLISPDGFASPGFEYGQSAEVPFTMTLMRYVMPKPLLTMSLEPAYADPKSMTAALATRYYDLMLVPGAREAMLERMRETVLINPVPLLRTIRAPTLLLWGEKDQMIPFANAADYLAALPNATLVPLPELGHLPFEEAPARSLVPLRAFLNRTQSTLAGI